MGRYIVRYIGPFITLIMKQILFNIYIFNIAIFCHAVAQSNLVPNSSFENYSNCPLTISQIDSATAWFQPNTYGSSTDYFNSCTAWNYVSVPSNMFGFQYAKSGNAYAGITVYLGQQYNYREYLEVELTDTMIAGEQYCVSFYVSLADIMQYGINRIGAYISNNPVYYNSPSYQPILVQPQVENNSGVISDTSNWKLVSGVYIANGGEKYLTIGNFYNDSNTTVSLVHPNQPASWAYYYIDDVSVVHGLCSTGIIENSRQEEPLILSPNPAREKVTINIKRDEKISVFSIEGRLLLEDFESTTVDVSEWDDGIYIVRATAEDGRLRVGKLIVSR